MSILHHTFVFIQEKVWLENSLSQLTEAISEPNLFPYNTPHMSPA